MNDLSALAAILGADPAVVFRRACRAFMRATNTMPPRDRGRADLSAAEIEQRMADADAQQKAARKRA